MESNKTDLSIMEHFDASPSQRGDASVQTRTAEGEREEVASQQSRSDSNLEEPTAGAEFGDERYLSGTSTITAPPSITSGNTVSCGTPVAGDSPMSIITPNTGVVKGPAALKKKPELIRPLFSRTNTSEKSMKGMGNKSMIVETETVDSSNVPSVTLPIAPSALLNINERIGNGSSNSTNLSSVRSKKSSLFGDQTTQGTATGQQANNPVHDNDNVSITGSIRNPTKHLNPAESHMNMAKPGATKADVFAAKVANAVGDVSESDSEETFVYESAPDGLSTVNTLPAKGATASGSVNIQHMRNQRNVSMPMATLHPFSPLATWNIPLNEDSSEVRRPVMFETDDATYHPDRAQHTLTKAAVEQVSEPGRPVGRNPGQSSRNPSTTSFSGLRVGAATHNPSQLRTTTSKLFDVKGSTLRRYSGVPDDVNIEDYIDQYDEEQEIESAGGYADTYDYDDFEDDDELTPLNVSKANNNLRSQMARHNLNKKNASSYGSVEQAASYSDITKDEYLSPKALRGKRTKSRPNQQYLQQEYHSPHDFFNDKKNVRLQMIKNIMYFFLFVFGLLGFGFIAGFLLATTKDLQDVKIVAMDDVLVSFDELVFDLSVQAFNPGFMAIQVYDVELDIFAKSSYLNKAALIPIFDDSQTEYQTVLLGGADKFESPLEFTSGLFNRNPSVAKSAVKLLQPGRNNTGLEDGKNHKIDDDSDKWKIIMEHPFELIVRGTFKYEIPIFGTQRSVPITKTVAINPSDEDSTKRVKHSALK